MYLIKLPPTPATPQDSVDNIPSLDQCWLQCIAVLSSFANNSFHINDQVPTSFSPNSQTAEFAIDRLQRCLLRRGDTVPSGMALLKCYDATVFPLLSSYGRSDRDKSYIIGIATSSLLASSEVLAQQPAYASLWLRFIDLLCRFIREGGAIGEMTTERMKNLLMVMMVEKRFDTMSAAAGQNVLEATMTMLDSYCPAIRSELDRAFSPTENPKPDKVEEKEVKEEKMEEEVKEEVKTEEEVKEKEKEEEKKNEVKDEEKVEEKEKPAEEVKEEEEKEEVKEVKEEMKTEEVKEEMKTEEEKEQVKKEEEQTKKQESEGKEDAAISGKEMHEEVQQKEENVQSTTQSSEMQNGEDVIIQVKE